MVIYAPLSLVLSTLHKRSQELKQSQDFQLGVWVQGYEGHKLTGICCHSILGDPGAVSRAGRKGATNVFKHRWKSPWVPTLTGPFPNGQENAGS